MSKRRIEQGVIDSFRGYAERVSAFHGAKWESFSLGGQDRSLASDYIFTNSTEFCLIEFKDNRSLIASEGVKSICRSLCRELEHNADLRELSRKCHHIAWEEREDVRSAPYLDMVCCKRHLPGAFLRASTPNVANERSSEQFCNALATPPPDVQIGMHDFERYLQKLLSFSDLAPEDLVVIADNVQGTAVGGFAAPPPKLVVKRLSGLQAIVEWIEQRRRTASPQTTR